MAAGTSSMILLRIAARSPPVDRSMIASAPYLTAILAFWISAETSESSVDVPMLALILVRSPLPTPSGTAFFRFLFFKMTVSPLRMLSRRE